MGAASRRKGASGEREIVALAQSLGLSASREWQNAQHGDPAVRAVDVRIGEHRAQVKRTAAGHKALYDALAGVDFLFIRTDGNDWLAVLPAEKLLAMLSKLNFEIAAQNSMTGKSLEESPHPRPKVPVAPENRHRIRGKRGRYCKRHRTPEQRAASRMAALSNAAQREKYGLDGLRERARKYLTPYQFEKGENKMSDKQAAVSTKQIEDAIQIYAAFHPAGSDPTERIEALGLSNDAINRALAILDDEGLLVLTVGGNDIQNVSYDLTGITRDEGMVKLAGLRGRKQAEEVIKG